MASKLTDYEWAQKALNSLYLELPAPVASDCIPKLKRIIELDRAEITRLRAAINIILSHDSTGNIRRGLTPPPSSESVTFRRNWTGSCSSRSNQFIDVSKMVKPRQKWRGFVYIYITSYCVTTSHKSHIVIKSLDNL